MYVCSQLSPAYLSYLYESIRNQLRVSSQQTQNICIPCVQRQPNVFDVGPTIKCTNVLHRSFVFAGVVLLATGVCECSFVRDQCSCKQEHQLRESNAM